MKDLAAWANVASLGGIYTNEIKAPISVVFEITRIMGALGKTSERFADNDFTSQETYREMKTQILHLYTLCLAASDRTRERSRSRTLSISSRNHDSA